MRSKQIYFNNNIGLIFCYVIVMFLKYLLIVTCDAMLYNLIKNSQAVKKGAAPKKAMVKKDVKSKVAAKKWL